MNKRLLLICSCFLLRGVLYSQAIEKFHVSPPESLVSNSKYNVFYFLDSREDTSSFGKVYSGHYKRKVPLKAAVDMSTQLNWLLQATLDSNASDGELLFQLRKLEFVELGGDMPDYGYCPLRANLYVKKNNDYFFLAKIDTFLATEKGLGHIDVTASLLKQIKYTLNKFVLGHLQSESGSKRLYSFQQICKIDSIEKTHLPLYNTPNYTNGVYLTYESFKVQKPDYKLLKVERKLDEINSLTLLDKKAKRLKISYKEVYAFVYADTAYISDYYGCYPLQKINSDFYFKGKGRVLAKDESVALARAIYGIIGEEYVKQNAFALFNAKLDHCDGSVIWYNKIK